MLNERNNIAQQPVFLDMDGAIDDLISLITLLTFPNFQLTGVSVMNGNCFSDNAVQSILRIFNLFGLSNIQVAISDAQLLNNFPANWRAKADLFNHLDLIKKNNPDESLISNLEAVDFTASTILSQDQKTIVILTGPATNLSKTIEKYPQVLDKIEKIYWMAGAFYENGNVIYPDHDGSAEWNIFCDPISAQKLIKSGLKIVLFPLDVCNQVPIDNYLIYLLKKQSKYILSKLIIKILDQLLINHPSYTFWDVIPSMALEFPDIVRFSNTSIDIELRGTSTGNIFKNKKGAPIYFATCIDDEKFYTDFANQMKTI